MLLTSARLRAWAARVFDPVPAVGQPFRSPAEAQFWFEWRQKGHFMPTVIADRRGRHRIRLAVDFQRVMSPGVIRQVCAACGSLLWTFGLLFGIVTGRTGTDDSGYVMGQFLATRPMADADLARSILKTAGRSVIGHFLVPLGPDVVDRVCNSSGEPCRSPVCAFESTRVVVLSGGPSGTVGDADIHSVADTLGAKADRSDIDFRRHRAVLRNPISFKVRSAAFETYTAIILGLRVVIGGTFVLGTAAVFIAARRRSLISSRTVYVAFAAWLLLCTVALLDPLHPERGWYNSAFFAGVLALAVAPFAVAPLALAWNRHR